MNMRKKVLIWVRVSTSEQEHSLQAQIDACVNLAKQLGFEVVVVEEPVSESAKVAGKAFKKMLKKLKDERNGYDGIIVEYLDRFSRNVPVAAKAIKELTDKGIFFYSVVENINTENKDDLYRAYGIFSNAERENDIRGLKTKRSITAWTKKGYLTSKPPIGYKRNTNGSTTEEKKLIIHSNDAQYIKKAFLMLDRGISMSEISQSLKNDGLNINNKRLSKMFRVQTYAGRIQHKSLGDEIIEGKHEPIISPHIFDRIQQKLQNNENGKQKISNPNSITYLKGATKCSCCGAKLTSYEKLKNTKKYYYYKCPTIGCKVNINAKKLNTSFINTLNNLTINGQYQTYLSETAVEVYNEIYGYEVSKSTKLKEEKTKLNNRIERIEEDYYDDKITEQKKDLMIRKSEVKIEEIETELEQYSILDIDDVQRSLFTDLESLDELWEDFSFSEKQQVHRLLYEGSVYDKSNSKLENNGLLPLYHLAS